METFIVTVDWWLTGGRGWEGTIKAVIDVHYLDVVLTSTVYIKTSNYMVKVSATFVCQLYLNKTEKKTKSNGSIRVAKQRIKAKFLGYTLFCRIDFGLMSIFYMVIK